MGLHEFSWPQHMGRLQEMETSPSRLRLPTDVCGGRSLLVGGMADHRCSTKRDSGSWVRCAWVDLGLYHRSSIHANTSRAGKVGTMENTSCSICNGL